MKTANIYLIKLYNDHEEFYKIGMSVHKYCRFYEIMKVGYKVKIIFMPLKLDFRLAMKIEEMLHTLYPKYHPGIRFGGYTECYKDICVKDVKDTMTRAIGHSFNYLENIEISWR